MKRTLLVLALVCIALAAMASAVMADPWWRGQNNTALLNWTAPDDLTFSHVGSGTLRNSAPYVYVYPTLVSIGLPNFLTNNPVKLMQIQVWFVGSKPTFLDIHGIYGNPGNETVQDFTLLSEIADSTYSQSNWQVEPNPYWEQISLGKTTGTTISKIVIDTWCVPEPSSIIVLVGGLGSLLAFRRRRA